MPDIEAGDTISLNDITAILLKRKWQIAAIFLLVVGAVTAFTLLTPKQYESHMKILVKNEDETTEDFESDQLKREKLVPPGEEIPVLIGPLEPGDYNFFGDFHRDTAQGVLVAK